MEETSMGRADTVTKSYLRRNDIFADVFNSYVYEGRQVLQPGNLREMDPAEMTQDDLDKFQTSLREVLGYIKHCGNGAELLQYARTEKRLQNLERDAIAVIAETTNTKIRISEEQEETGNMCKGIEELIEAGKTEGREVGRAEGREVGRVEGRAEGIAEGIEKGEISMLVSLFNEGEITISTAARKAGMTETEFEEKFLVK